MKQKHLNNTLGFTLIELLLALALISLIIIISANLLVFGTKAQRLTVKEYSMQSDIRRATEKTNEVVRYSKAVFAVPKTFVESIDVMDPGWDYIMVSPDSKRIVTMEYDSVLDKHVEKIVVEESENILYYIQFEKDESAHSGSVIKYKIYAYNADKNGNKTNEKLLFESTVETVNAIQIADKGSVSSPSVALAFRSDGQTSGKGKNQRAYITIIVDISNSMNRTPNDGGSNTSETNNSRITKVRNALVGNGTTSGTGIIQLFAKEDNVFISLVPFANTANYPSPHANSKPNEAHPEYEVYESADLNTLLTTIKNLKADGHRSSLYGSGHGGTNTGDGLRRAYYLHENYRSKNNIDPKDQVHHYIIMLVDGETTFETSYFNWKDEGYYIDSGRSETISWNSYRRFNWKTDWKSTIDNTQLPDGNIDIHYSNNYTPNNEPLTRNNYYNSTIYYKDYNRWSGYFTASYTGRIVEYGKKNDSFNNILITGNGSTVISNNVYINNIGSSIKSFDSGIRSYIIGYAKNLGTHINKMGEDIGTDSQNIYKFDDPNFDLDEIFKNIATDIMADFWLAAGPQIIK